MYVCMYILYTCNTFKIIKITITMYFTPELPGKRKAQLSNSAI